MAELVYTKFLSASTNGKQIALNATSTPGTLIHQTPSVAGGLDVMDQVFIYATNRSASTLSITVQWGGVTTTDQITWDIKATIGPVLIVPGFILNNNLIIRIFGSSSINIAGYVYRIPVNSQGGLKLQ